MSVFPQKNGSQKKLRCSYCAREFSREETNHMPFCSQRCQLLDLGNWLGEEYGLPFEGAADRIFEEPEEDEV